MERHNNHNNDTQHNDTEHNVLILDTQHKWHLAKITLSPGTKCLYDECHHIFYCYAERGKADCRYAECHYAERHGTINAPVGACIIKLFTAVIKSVIQ
jgi:hypothetical protein